MSTTVFVRVTRAVTLLCLAAVTSVACADDRPETPETPEASVPRERSFDHVLVISVDGLRSDALMAMRPSQLPNLHRLLRGASTLNARTDASCTVTLPNHVGMVTGRGLEGTDGHGWSANEYAPDQPVLHEVAGRYIPSIFDVAHDRGVYTAVYATKTKFALFERSWGSEHGAPDRIPPDHGTNKIDDALCLAASASGSRDAALTTAVLDELARARERRLLFIHFGGPDWVGHDSGWDLTEGSPYLSAVTQVDEQLGRILGLIDTSPALRNRTAVIVTSDHGGGAPHRSHVRPEMWVNYIIPVLVWLGDDRSGGDLYELNSDRRRDPSIEQPPLDASPPPIRNADVANLALALLGLPPVHGSPIDAAPHSEPAISGLPASDR